MIKLVHVIIVAHDSRSSCRKQNRVRDSLCCMLCGQLRHGFESHNTDEYNACIQSRSIGILRHNALLYRNGTDAAGQQCQRLQGTRVYRDCRYYINGISTGKYIPPKLFPSNFNMAFSSGTIIIPPNHYNIINMA